MTQELMNNIRQEARNRAIEHAKFIQKRYTANYEQKDTKCNKENMIKND